MRFPSNYTIRSPSLGNGSYLLSLLMPVIFHQRPGFSGSGPLKDLSLSSWTGFFVRLSPGKMLLLSSTFSIIILPIMHCIRNVAILTLVNLDIHDWSKFTVGSLKRFVIFHNLSVKRLPLSVPFYTVHEILTENILGWFAIPFSNESSQS